MPKPLSTTTPTGCTRAYEASLDSATELDAAIDAFLADPTEETLEAAKQAWLAARDDYGLTEAFRFYGGPIDNETDGPEGLINAWPLDEVYIDYVEGDPAAWRRQRPRHLPDDRRRTAHLAQRAGWRGEHLHGLARHRVPPLGPGPVHRRAGRAPGHRLHDCRQRRPPGDLPGRHQRPAARAPDRPRRGVGAGCRQLPRRVRRRRIRTRR